jgi:acyl-CoA synthetase (NDP forming)
MVNVHARLNASFTPLFSRLKPGPISVISQSGGVAHLIGYQALDEGIGLGKVIGLGNRCNVEFADLLPYFAEDHLTRCLILYIEGLEDPRRLMAGITNFVSQKPILAMKAGRSSAALKAARSHTGSLAGRYEIYDASLRQAGAIVCQTPDELLDTAKILAMLPPLRGRKAAVVSFQAGPGILLTDEVVRQGLSMASFSPHTQEALNRLLPPMTIRSNPVDLAFARDEQMFEESLGWILNDSNVDALVIFLLQHPFMTPRQITPSLLRQKQSSPKPILLCANSPRGLIEDEIAELENRGIPVYPLPQRAIRALKGLLEYGEVKKRMAEDNGR